MSIPFTSSDVWLLVAIAMAESEPPVRLPAILFAGDYVNKAVFTSQELRRGFSKLTQAGYVVDADGTYSLSDAARRLVMETEKRSRNWYDTWKEVEKELGATRGPENAPGFEDARFPYPALTDKIIADADRQYRKRFNEMLAQLNKADRRKK